MTTEELFGTQVIIVPPGSTSEDYWMLNCRSDGFPFGPWTQAALDEWLKSLEES